MSLIRIVIILIELSILLFLMSMVFLTTSWIADDSFAVSASELDWWLIAGQRLLITVVFSVIASIILWRINKPLFAWSRFSIERLPNTTAIIFFVGLFLSALVGAVYFAVEKPYI